VFTSRHTGTLGGVVSDNPDAPQLVIGSKGTDVLVGGPQADTLVPAQGDQTLTGGAGSDKFVFGEPGIKATITDFDPSQDVLVFEHLGNGDASGSHHHDTAASPDLHDVHIHVVQGKAVIQAAGDTVVLDNVNPHDLGPMNFLLHI
jgi:Ca2+-binding RTX toxin-like protein